MNERIAGPWETASLPITRKERDSETNPWCKVLSVKDEHNGILFDVDDFWHHPGTLNDGICETVGVTRKVTVVDLADTNGFLNLFVSDLEED